ncbi:uncharacterized protein LOC130744751 [Lotus japonicus]|uniref:uncharacterized protein LOC130744751 n=1 Tax=Lotus japonicus TaxID=34305 RepID=UPI00258B5A17|nr:uncharacterized protein LOC130744751 [Lotus japonicus]
MIGFDDVKIISWNVRGAVNEHGKLFVKELIRSKKPDIFILLETRCPFSRVAQFWNSMQFSPSFISEATGFSGGIWVLTNNNSAFSMRLVDMHTQAISFEIWRDSFAWVCTAVYASPIPAQREALWHHLTGLRDTIMIPWMLVRDMNEILHPSEVRGGEFIITRAARFAALLEDCRLVDLGAVGGRFTWFRKTNNRVILSKRLDRALGDIDWRVAFPDAFVEVLHRIHSDHSPLLIHCGISGAAPTNRPFRFIAAWADHPEYKNLVAEAWVEDGRNIVDKLDRVRSESISFNRETFGNIFRRKRWVEGRLRGVQRELDARITSDMVRFEAELQAEYRDILRQEELLWFQKARENRVRFGDRNTSYFHTHTIIRRKRNRIHRLKLLSDGEWHSENDVLVREVQAYFQNLFARDHNIGEAMLHHDVFPSLSDVHRNKLMVPVTKDEVRKALMSMKPYTAPGPDGFQPFFFKKYWEFVGDDLWTVVRNAFNEGSADRNLMETLIVLIPKVDTPSTIKEFRPISLCNVTYKLITKVIVNRVRPFLNRLIGPMQSSFLPGRGTTDNVFLAQEIMHYMNSSCSRKGSLAFKIDLEKAYDSVSWSFLRETLDMFGFPNALRDLIMCCVTSSRLSILWNGARLPAFSPGRGLRQGDPLSPYLFVMCMERLSVQIHQLVNSGDWKPIRVSPRGPPISHLLFADDVLLFCEATTAQVQLVADTLQTFCDCSGLKINVSKSKAISSKGVRPEVRSEIRSIAPIPFVRDLGKYLGFPLKSGRSARNRFNYLLENVQKKMASWKTNLLNMAGRVCLARSVIATIPTYTMQVFWLPRGIINNMNMILRNFIWSNRGGHRGWHLLSWNTVIKERKNGGLGIKEMGAFNTALLGKAVWQMLQDGNKLWIKVLQHKYLKEGSILNAQVTPRSSAIWKGILKARDQLKDGFKFMLGDGNSSIWYRDWSSYGILANQLPFVHISDTNLCLKDVIVGNQWVLDRCFTVIPDQVRMWFDNVSPKLSSNEDDIWVWDPGSNGQYTVKEGYTWVRDLQVTQPPQEDWTWVWRLAVPEKIRLFVWRALHGALPVNEKRFHCHLATTAACSRCSFGQEDCLHCLRDCPHSMELWSRLGALSWTNFRAADYRVWIISQAKGPNAIKFVAGMWGVWKWRNNMMLDPNPWPISIAWQKLCMEHDDILHFLHQDQEIQSLLLRVDIWQPPPIHFVKLNTDGSYLDEQHCMGGGGLIRDNKGKFLTGFQSLKAAGCPFLAEALALREGLLLAWNTGYRNVLCEVDCHDLVALLVDTDVDRVRFHGNRAVLRELQHILSRNWNISLSWSHRNSNMAADWIAKRGAHGLHPGVSYLDRPPSALESIMLKDSFDVP